MSTKVWAQYDLRRHEIAPNKRLKHLSNNNVADSDLVTRLGASDVGVGYWKAHSCGHDCVDVQHSHGSGTEFAIHATFNAAAASVMSFEHLS